MPEQNKELKELALEVVFHIRSILLLSGKIFIQLIKDLLQNKETSIDDNVGNQHNQSELTIVEEPIEPIEPIEIDTALEEFPSDVVQLIEEEEEKIA